MKVLLLVTLFVGATMAKPSLEKKLLDLLQNLLEKKDEGAIDEGAIDTGAGPMEACDEFTTMFDELDFCPFDKDNDYMAIFDNFNVPLDAGEVDASKLKEAIEKVFSTAKEILQGLNNSLVGQQAPESYEDIVARLDDFYVNAEGKGEDLDIWSPFFKIISLLARGAVAGSVGGDAAGVKDEPGCSFDGDHYDLLMCVLRKMTMFGAAMDISFERAVEKLALGECYIEEPDEYTPQALAETLAAELKCVVGKFAEVKSQLPNAPANPLAKLLRLHAVATSISEIFYQVGGYIHFIYDALTEETGKRYVKKKFLGEQMTKKASQCASLKRLLHANVC